MRSNRTEESGIDQEQLLPLPEARELLDIVYIINALLQSGGNVSRAAEELGVGRRTIYDLMDKYGISCSDGKLSIELKPLLQHVEMKVPASLEEYFA